MTTKKPSQNDKIIEYIKEHGSITQADAVKLGCYRLAARMSEIKKLGYRVLTTYVVVRKENGTKTRIARYSFGESE